MCVVKDGPDVRLFTHPSALTKLALWIGEAIAEQERESKGKLGHGGRGTPLVVAGLNDSRGIYVVVGTGGGGGGGGAGMRFGDREAAKERKGKREAKAKAKEEKRQNKERVREEKRAAKRRSNNEEEDDDDDEEDETESEASDSSSDDDEEEEDKEEVRGYGRNRFGNAFQEVVQETNARVRIDSFEHCVVEVKKEDLAGFLESLSMKAVVG
jgi:cell division control protein 45